MSAARFRARGFELTSQRHAIFAALEGNSTHPTAEAVHAEVIKTLPMVSLRTVCQTLNKMISLGEIMPSIWRHVVTFRPQYGGPSSPGLRIV